MKSEPIKDEIKRLLGPRQVGVGCAGGAEAIAHAAQAVLHDKKNDPDHALLKIDFRNAFNVVSRDFLLQELDAEMPEVSH